MVAESVEWPLCDNEDIACDRISVDIVKKPLVSSLYDDESVPRICDSIEMLLPVTVDIVFGECD